VKPTDIKISEWIGWEAASSWKQLATEKPEACSKQAGQPHSMRLKIVAVTGGLPASGGKRY
jgi:hypothetical protein